jgi:hypothetical protein
MTTALVSLSEISDELARQLRIRQYRVDAGMPVDLEYHPDAAATAKRLRASMQPTTYAIVRGWLNDLVSAAAVLPRDVSIDALAGGIAAACSEFPASVWNATTLRLALQTIEWLRSPAQVYKLLKPEADKLMSVVEGLEAIAKAKPALRAVPSPKPYVVTSTPDWVASKRGRGDHSRPALNIPPPPRSVAEQIALLRDAG